MSAGTKIYFHEKVQRLIPAKSNYEKKLDKVHYPLSSTLVSTRLSIIWG
jgi:hypothetical protein